MADEKTTHEIISRKEAKQRGLKYYFTGNPCLRWHISLRSVASISCCECGKIKNLEWRAKNIELVRKRERDHYANNPEWAKEKHRKRQEKHGEKLKKKARIYYASNKEKAKETQRRYRKKNADVVNEKSRKRAVEYRARFPEKAKAGLWLSSIAMQRRLNWWTKFLTR